MLGAILGDIVGSPYEFDGGEKTTDFPLFNEVSNYTDDSLMTLAVGQALLDADGNKSLAQGLLVKSMQQIARDFRVPPGVGAYGANFGDWLHSDDPQPYGSFGNGSAMRCSAAGWLYPTLEDTIDWAEITAAVSHNHPEGIKGAQATAAMIFLARTEGAEAKAEHKKFITERFGYDLTRTVDQIRPGYRHVESCQKTVPEAITCYLESSSYEEAIRLAVSLGGDTDTLAAIAGSIAEPAFGIPEDLAAKARSYLPAGLLAILDRFNAWRDSQGNPL